jgi:hypothetical protein
MTDTSTARHRVGHRSSQMCTHTQPLGDTAVSLYSGSARTSKDGVFGVLHLNCATLNVSVLVLLVTYYCGSTPTKHTAHTAIPVCAADADAAAGCSARCPHLDVFAVWQHSRPATAIPT